MGTDRDDGEFDTTTHPLLTIHEVPPSLTALRVELALHVDVTNYAQTGATFEECLARIATFLDIGLDGDYDVGPLCEMLVQVLRRRRFGLLDIHDLPSLKKAELVETKEGIRLQAASELSIDPTSEVTIVNKPVAPMVEAAVEKEEEVSNE